MLVPDESFPKQLRITHRADFDRVFQQGAVASDANLVVHGIRNELGFARIGLSVSKKVGNSPTRNLWKRLIRESFRKNKQQIPVGVDIVVRPRRGASPDLHAIAQSLPKLARQIERRIAKG